uniref:Uncharacterized protein n=1 Tax=Ralstonia solanacearum TaxID=305 RepID=A0A0S4TWE0_RALSL|nr:protein of unknown function [Ralstonia solanacearum]
MGALDRERLQAALDGVPEAAQTPPQAVVHVHAPVARVEAAHPPLAH